MPSQTDPTGFDSWAILELMGHVRMAGRVTEENRFGTVVGRIDVPTGVRPDCIACNGTGIVPLVELEGMEPEPEHPCRLCGSRFTTVYFGGGSVYRMTPTTEEVARAVAKGSQPEPVHRWELPSPEKAAKAFAYDQSGERYDPDDEPL